MMINNEEIYQKDSMNKSCMIKTHWQDTKLIMIIRMIIIMFKQLPCSQCRIKQSLLPKKCR